jgi:hypothetical protein
MNTFYCWPWEYRGRCIHCDGPAFWNHDDERMVFQGLPDCLCEIKPLRDTPEGHGN